jgi:hypothetical protein
MFILKSISRQPKRKLTLAMPSMIKKQNVHSKTHKEQQWGTFKHRGSTRDHGTIMMMI